MKLKAGCWMVFIVVIVILSSCSAVVVTVGDNGQVLEGNAAVLTCDYERTLKSRLYTPEIRWNEIINGSYVTILVYYDDDNDEKSIIYHQYRDARITVEEGRILTITNISRGDNGRIYQCDVTIPGDTPSTATGALTLSVAFYGTMLFEINKSPVTEGESAMFVCSVEANPVPQIVLYKDEIEITTETTMSLTYKVDIAGRSDGGNYRCEASNIAGSGTSQIETLEVYYKPEFDLDEEVTVGPGDLHVITPEVSANPSDVTYQWTTDPPGIDDKDIDPATFTFNVPDVNNIAMFTITVTVTNSIGSTIKSVKITVSEPSCNKHCKNGGIRAIHNSSYMGLIIGMFFGGIFVGAFGLFAGLVSYMKIKQKMIVDKRSMDKKIQDPYMEYRADTGNENETYYQDLEQKEETTYVNVKPTMNKK